MTRNDQNFQIAPNIGLQIYYEKMARAWWGFYYNIETDEQIGEAWHAFRRDDVLIFRPEVTAWHYSAAR